MSFELREAISKAEFPAIVKDSKNPHFKSTFASLTAIKEAIQPALAKVGIRYHYILGTDSISLIIAHTPTKTIETHEAPLFGENAQQYGASTTYQRRYLLQVAFDLGAVDDDGESTMGRGMVAEVKGEPAPARSKRW